MECKLLTSKVGHKKIGQIMRHLSSLTLIATLSLGSVVSAALIDFEDAASYGGDNAAISASYFDSKGVSITAFAGDNESSATQAVLSFEAEGRDNTDGFWSSSQERDVAYAGDLGDFLLKAGTTDLSYGKSRYFRMDIEYNDATSAASGEIWDIDGKEQYQVTAFDSSGTTLGTLVSPVGNLNAMPWAWSFDMGESEVISKIEVDFISTESTLRGFAFDNFNATEANPNASVHAAPLPPAAPVALAALAVCAVARRKRNRRIEQDA